MMTEKQIQRLQALKVTGGDWRLTPRFAHAPMSAHRGYGDIIGLPKLEGDMELMVSAKRLLAEVVRLRLIARAAENCIAYMGNRRQDEMVEALSRSLGVDFTGEPVGGRE